MIKKVFFLLAGFLLFITSCKSVDIINTPEEGFNYVKSIKNYIADIKITFKNARNEESILFKQYSNSNNQYRLDLEGDRSYIYKDDKIYVKDIKNGVDYLVEEKFDEIYRYTFLNEYIKLIYSMDEVEYFEEVYDYGDSKKSYYLAKVNIPTNNLNIKEAILYLDSEKLIPSKLVIYDSKGEQRVLIEYSTFDILEEIDGNLFNH